MTDYYKNLGLELPKEAKVRIHYAEGLRFHIVWIDCPHDENLLEAWFGSKKRAEDFVKEHNWQLITEKCKQLKLWGRV